MAAKKKAAKYELSRSDISERLHELVSSLENANVYTTSPDEMNGVRTKVLGALEGLADDVHTKA